MELMLEIHEFLREAGLLSGGVTLPGCGFSLLERPNSVGRLVVGIFCAGVGVVGAGVGVRGAADGAGGCSTGVVADSGLLRSL